MFSSSRKRSSLMVSSIGAGDGGLYRYSSILTNLMFHSCCQEEDYLTKCMFYNCCYWKDYLTNCMFYSCQATNLAGTGQQATPVTVRHTGSRTLELKQAGLVLFKPFPSTCWSQVTFIVSVTPYHAAARCPIDNYCLNGGSCAYYKSIGELVCRYILSKLTSADT